MYLVLRVVCALVSYTGESCVLQDFVYSGVLRYNVSVAYTHGLRILIGYEYSGVTYTLGSCIFWDHNVQGHVYS